MKSDKKLSRDEIKELVKKELHKTLSSLDPNTDGDPKASVLVDLIVKAQVEQLLDSIAREERILNSVAKEEEEREKKK
tara:strand:- start:216 stop:449 length:234 start_codon:yes stop_codon:yes gene_type:complete